MTEQEIDAARTPAGGWTKATLETWGVPWPPPSGWKDCLIAGQVNNCRACTDGECFAKDCPQLRDNEPAATGRHCPLDRGCARCCMEECEC